MRPVRRDAAVALVGAVAAVVPALWLYGFTVDDALIPARYAAHLAQGMGYRFNAEGAVTDGVTPLGFPYLLAPFARGGPLAALAAARTMGLVVWTLAAAVLAVAVHRVGGSRLRYGALVILAASAPLAAWSSAGLETGLAAALGALAVALPQLGCVRGGAAAAGLVAALRPDALPWALMVSVAPAPAHADGSRGVRIQRVAAAAAPFVLVVTTRALVFGRAVPLSVLAKPSDASHGAAYAAACFLLTGPVAVVAPFAWARLGGWGRGLCAAVLVHFAAVALAGGDWMPLSRLVVPALPTVVLAAAHVASVADPRVTALRFALALAGEVFQIVRVGPAEIAGVSAARLAVVEGLRPSLAGTPVVAALDIGWLGAATDATLVDLAGLTDPDIAVLPGGHTSKAIPARLLDARGVGAVVLLLKDGEPLVEPWTDAFFARIVELRLAALPGIGDTFVLAAESHVPHLHYVVLKRRDPPAHSQTR